MILHWAFALYLAGLGAAGLVGIGRIEMIALILSGTIAAIFLRKMKAGSILLVLSCFPLGILLGDIERGREGEDGSHEIYSRFTTNEPLTIYGEVIASDLEIYSQQAVIVRSDVVESRGRFENVSARILVILPTGFSSPQVSDIISFDCTLGDKSKYIGTAQVAKHRIDSWCIAQRGSIKLTGRFNEARRNFDKFKDRLLENLSSGLSGDRESLYQGVVFGKEARGLSRDLKREFYDSGISHLVVASGAQVALMIFPLLTFFYRIRNRWVQGLMFILMGVAMIVLYLIVGHASSILRAISVGFVLLAGKAIGRSTNPLNSLSLVGMFWLVFDPGNLKDAGFLLSYSASFGILYMAPIIVDWAEKRFPGGLRPSTLKSAFHVRTYFAVKRNLVYLGIVTIASQWGVMPVIAWFFGRISLNGIMANLIAVPLGSMVLVMGAISGVAGFIHPGLSWILNSLASPFLVMMIATAKFFSGIEHLTIENVKPPIVVVVAYYIVTIAVTEILKRSTSLLRKVSGLNPGDN